MLGWIKAVWARLRRPSASWSVLALSSLGILIGVAGTAGFNVSMHATGTTEFCTSCHSMGTFTLPEFQKSVHGSNRTGIVATCSDCHIPHALIPKIIRKTTAGMRDVYGELTGVIATQELYDAKRLELAEGVWATMRANDSRECRHCHNPTAMNPELQSAAARDDHAKMASEGKTCIDCHQGVAHQKPVTAEEAAAADDFSL